MRACGASRKLTGPVEPSGTAGPWGAVAFFARSPQDIPESALAGRRLVACQPRGIAKLGMGRRHLRAASYALGEVWLLSWRSQEPRGPWGDGTTAAAYSLLPVPPRRKPPPVALDCARDVAGRRLPFQSSGQWRGGLPGSRSSGPALSGRGNDFSLAFSSEEATFGAM
jgi:hypothetical protein